MVIPNKYHKKSPLSLPMLSMSAILIHKIKIGQLPWTENESRNLVFDSSFGVSRDLSYYVTVIRKDPNFFYSRGFFKINQRIWREYKQFQNNHAWKVCCFMVCKNAL